jgi:hypothetical protein
MKCFKKKLKCKWKDESMGQYGCKQRVSSRELTADDIWRLRFKLPKMAK